MAKRIWIGLVTVLFGCVGGYLYHMVTDPPATRIVVVKPAQPVKHDGEAETSDTIEPLVVETGVVAQRMPVGDSLPLPRVVLTAGMRQPPRPDDDCVRMPYADEDEDWLGVAVDRGLRLLHSSFPYPLENVFDPSEEAEPRDVTPEPATLPTPEYHHGHCPRFEYRR